jgi:type I restriction enzyme, S subunit
MMFRKVETFCTLVRGSSPRPKGDNRYYGGNIPRLMVEDVTRDGMYVEPKIDFLTEAGAELSRPMKKGDLTMVVSGSPGVPAILNVDACIHDGFVGFRNLDNKVIDTEYLFYWFLFSLVETDRNATGAIFRNLTTHQIKQLDVPTFAITKQRHIATHLKTRLAEVEKARKAVEIQLQETEKLANAIIFNSINSGKPQTLPLGKVLDEIKQGIGENWADFPVLGATRDGLAPAKSPPGKKPERYKPVFPGTVFYNPMRILIGSIAFVDQEDTPGITSPDYVVLKGKPGIVDSRWFYYWLRSPLGEHCILSLARGAVRERMLFSRLSKGNIELPDFKVQQDAAAALAELKPLRRTLERQRDEITQLPQRILAQAFEIET